MKANFNNYHHPENINCPRDYVKEVKVIYDGTQNDDKEDFSIALLRWGRGYTLAIRWNHTMREELDKSKRNNINTCLGMPVSFSHPVWFVIPRIMHQSILVAISELNGINKENFNYAKTLL